MSRQLKTAPGLAALALSLGLVLAPGGLTRPADAADTPHARPAAHAAGHDPSVLEKVEGELEKAGHELGAHETPAGKPNILEPQYSLAAWTVVVFLGLLFVLTTFAWKPLLAALHHREEHLAHVLTETERARNEGEALLAEHRRRLAASEDQIRALIEEARKNAQAAADEIVKKAQAEAEASRQRAEREIGTARDQALSEIWTKTADLAVSVAGKVLNKSLTEDDHRRLVDAAVGALPAVRPATGHEGQLA